MKTIPVALATHLRQEQTSLAICWVITKNYGGIIRGTEHDQNIVIPSGTYAGTYYAGANITGSDLRSSSDLAVDNMDVEGAIPASTDVVLDVTVQEIEAGALDGAPVTVFVCNWTRPGDGVMVARSGNLGQLSRDSDQRYKTEVRGLLQKLSQQIGYTYGERCNVQRFGDARCGFNVETLRMDATISEVTSRRRFAAVTGSPVPTYLYPLGGEVTFTSGENAGFTRQVKRQTLNAGVLTIELFEPMPYDVEQLDGISVIPGCDRLWETCRFVYGNILNFRGYGLFIPGALQMLAGPDSTPMLPASAGAIVTGGESPYRPDTGSRPDDYIDNVINAGGSGIPTPSPPTSPTSSSPLPGGSAGLGGTLLDGPRVGCYTIGGNRNYNDPAFWDLAKWMDIVIVGIWRGWEGTYGPAATHTDYLLANGLPGKKVFSYYDFYEVARSFQLSGADSDVVAKLDSMGWWGYRNGSSGAIADSGFETLQQVNLSRFVPRDSSGKSSNEWLVERFHQVAFTGGSVNGVSATANPNLSGLFHDLMYWRARSDYDINRDGSTDYRDGSFSETETRRVFYDEVTHARSLDSGRLHIGNTGDFWEPGREIPALYQGLLDGGVLEGGMGESWSVERWGGWSGWLQGYQQQMSMFRRPAYALAGHKIQSPWRSRSQFDSSDWRDIRHGACAVWTMGDAGVYFYGNSYGWENLFEFDEWNNGGTAYKYLGAPIDEPQVEVWQAGCYRRRWTNGWTIVNPKGNGGRTLALGQSMRKIAGRSGYSDTSVNDGSTVTSVTLQDRDGIVLLNP